MGVGGGVGGRGKDAVMGRACADGAVVRGEVETRAEAKKKYGGH